MGGPLPNRGLKEAQDKACRQQDNTYLLETTLLQASLQPEPIVPDTPRTWTAKSKRGKGMREVGDLDFVCAL